MVYIILIYSLSQHHKIRYYPNNCMIKTTLLALFSVLLLSCHQGIKPGALYGDWKYTKIDKPKSDDPTDTVSNADLADNAPYISFLKNNQLIIHWGGKVLSHGSFNIEGNNINYTEQLPSGQKRTFPFWVSKLDDKNIIFETLDNEGSRVTAVRK